VYVNPNALSDEMVRQADKALDQAARSNDGLVRIAYLSGTRTHHRDFDTACGALARLLRKRSDVRLLLVGHIEIPTTLAPFEEQIRLVPLIPWQKLPELLADVDINLAPLELNNRFTDGKSSLKYMEAALLRVPTIASPTFAFREAIRHGENGFLCGSEQEWYDTLDLLVSDRELRERVGTRAQEDVTAHHLTRNRAAGIVECWDQIVRRFGVPARDRLSLAFVMRAPIAPAGGGYQTVFRLARYMESRGHLVRVYVEKIAHLADKGRPGDRGVLPGTLRPGGPAHPRGARADRALRRSDCHELADRLRGGSAAKHPVQGVLHPGL
jgi:hypothetical protein